MVRLEKLEDRNLLAGDVDFFQPLAAEGEGSMMLLLHREGSAPNDGIAVAERVPLGIGVNQSTRVDVNGFFSNLGDIDVYRAELRGGDILQLNLFGAGQTITVYDATGRELITSDSDANATAQTIETGEVNLPRGGNASLGRVLSTDGTYYVQVTGADATVLGGAYTLQMRVERPTLENAPVGTRQILFIDFNGAVVATDTFGGVGAASLTPMPSFLQSWGLTAADEDAVIDAVLEKLEEYLSTDIRAFGVNGDYLATGIPGQFDIEIRNSRDHADPFGQPHVSRIIIGGTQGELGIPTVGISEGLDVGNLDTTESAVVLLDLLSGQITPQSPINLNNVPIAPNSSRVALIGAAVGGIAAHEAGHFFGLFHTDLGNNVLNLIDSGGDILQVIGAGRDGIFGSSDDVKTGFINPDNFAPGTFTGFQDTLNSLSWALSTGKHPSSLSGVKFHDLNGNGIRDLTEPGLAGWTIYADLNGDGMPGLREPRAITGTDGSYTLSVPPGQHIIREVPQPGWRQTFPANNGSHSVLVRSNESIPDINFGNIALFGGVSGTVFNDLNGNSVFDQGEPGIPGIIIFLDLDGDNRIDLGEPMTTTDSQGNYSIAITQTGTFALREMTGPGWQQTFPTNAEREHIIVATPGASFPGRNFGNTSRLDYGDAPTAAQSGFAKSYPTTIADNGAVHGILPGFYLGSGIDGDPDGTPNVTATGDDSNTTLNDEDGVTFNAATIFPGSPAGEMTVTVATNSYSPGRINAWIDFNRDGDWDDPGEHVVVDRRASDGDHVLTFPVPANAISGQTYARVRYGYGRNMLPTGPDMAGEVEDYRIRVLSTNPVAVDDQFTVTQGSGPTTLDVLLNDLPSLSPPLRVIAAGATMVGVTAAGGQVTVAANGSGVVYTPPANFFGDDSFSYTIRDGAGNTDSADVSVTVLPSLVNPLAVDDSFTVQARSTNNQLRVLANDLTGQNPPIGIVSFDNPTRGGSVVLDNRGTANTGDDTLAYTPAANFTGTDQFTYTIQDQNLNTSTATVTVHVGDTGDDRVRIRLQATDLNGNPIQAIGVGEEFNLQVRVADDLRADDEDGNASIDRFGVAAAYLDILYNFNLVSLSSRAPFFDPNFQNARSISTTTPGLIDEAGAFQTNQVPLGRVCQIEIPNATCSPEDNEFIVLTIPMRATAQGVADFIGDPADFRTNGPLSPPSHDVLLFHPPAAVLLEQIRYENDSLTIIGSGGLPTAVDNTFHLAANTINNVLPVLANDIEVTNPPLTITATGVVSGAPALQGNVTIAANGSALLYTPRTGFVGTEQFTYTITNNVGLTDQAVVTVQVGNSSKDINLRLEVTDLNNRPISTITAGSEFKVRAYVQDIRTSAPDPSRTGVFAVYFDLLYNSGLVSTKNDPANRFGFDINFSAPYNANGLSANNSFFNIIDEVGAFQSGSEALGSSEYLLTQMTFRANTPGVAQFLVDPPDLSPFHDILLFEPPAPVALNRINLGVASITVVGVSAEGEYTNPQNSLDVNGDGFVSPIDVVMIFNDLSTNGPRQLTASDVVALGEGEGGAVRVPTGFVDTNGDGYASPADALGIINFLNLQSQREAEGEGNSVLFTNDITAAAPQSPAIFVAPSPSPVIDTAHSSSSLAYRLPAGSPLDTSAVDRLFYHHSQTESTSSARGVRADDPDSAIVSDDLLELLADRDSIEI
ncbi:MAG TPA: Ig-like domain-containing protein [Pirellulaceae bacterium]|nr:Ig-like domain-containing protein [Pirellulaceae bacterium]